jgi:hypothetical protein
VLHRGKIVERGTHEELLNRNGRYHSMWEKQAKAEMAARAANMEKAERAMREARLAAKDSGDDHSDDGGDSMTSSCHILTAPTTPAHELSGLNITAH